MRHWRAIALLGFPVTITLGCAARGGIRVIISTDPATGLENGWS